MWDRRAVKHLLLVCAGLAIAGLLLLMKNAVTGDSTGRDARLVFCLAAAQRSALADAAVTLGLGRPGVVPGELAVAGRSLTLEQWRRGHIADFDRACAALAAVAHPPQEAADGTNSEVWTIGSVLISVSAGAGLTWVNGEWRAVAERNRLQAEALSTATQAFAEEADTFIAEWVGPRAGGTPPDQMLRARRRELIMQLRAIQSTHRTWSAVAELRDRLLTGDLGENLATSLAASSRDGQLGEGPGSERDQRAAQLRGVLDRFESDVGWGAGAPLRASAWWRGGNLGSLPGHLDVNGSGEASQ